MTDNRYGEAEMKFDEWAEQYSGPNVDVPGACRDAWKAALLEAAKTCMAKHVNGNWKFDTRYECADAIRSMAEGE